jgi:RNA polymerase sigma factor (TIGR02999 family)
LNDSRDVTTLLQQWRAGDQRAVEQLVPLVYDELRASAARLMQRERPDHTLQATALVHEAYAKLLRSDVDWQDRAHFFAVAARQMRRILVDHAKSRNRDKRGGGVRHVTLESAAVVQAEPATELVELDAALTRFAELDPRRANVIELHYFGGLTIDEIAQAVGISTPTVSRDLKFARAWLYRELSRMVDA